MLSSDALDYPPGSTAVLTGTGFLAGETVTLQVVHADGAPPTGEDHQPWNVVANRSGKFVTTWHVCEDDCVGEVLLATAAGASSGLSTSAVFSDSNNCGTGVVTSLTPVGGACVAFTPAVGAGPDNYEVVQGGTYTMTITGVTECTGSAITVFVQSSGTGNFCFNATGGSGTYSGTFTVPNPACNTMPVSYKCGANATCTNPGSFGASGPHTGCGGVHLRASVFNGSCVKTGDDGDCTHATPSGACCLTDGSCVQVTAASCAAQGGTYHGDGTTCGSVSCPPPPATGACCLSDSSCVELTLDDCMNAGGTYHGDGTVCGSVNCSTPPPTGACCLSDGTCVELTQADCKTASGTYHGDGSTCGSVSCPQPPTTGACCLADGSCVEVTQADCATQAGTYHGDGSLCGSVSCPQPPATGACCLADGSCVVVTQTDCATMSGVYHGDGSLCGSVSCPQPTGACCLVDGSCVEVTHVDCTTMGGTYHGDGSTCGSVSCPTPVGACCLADGSCVQVTAAACATAGGAYHGDLSTCGSVSCPQPPQCFVLGFDTDDDGNGMAHGTKVDAEFDCNGVVFPVTITGSVNSSGHNTAAILNSTTGPASQDPDLLVGRGNILILQTDANETQCPANSGIYCTHNDDENGGTLNFAFCAQTTPASIVLVDIDGTDPASSVVLTDVNGKTRTYTVPGNWTGDKVTNFPQPGWKTLDLTTLANQPGFASTATAAQNAGFDPTAVVAIAVHLGGSGGVDDLAWCQ